VKLSEEDLTNVQTWARANRGPDSHVFQPVDNPNPFGDSPICKKCGKNHLSCGWDQERPDIQRLVLAAVAELRRYRKRTVTA